MNENMEVLNVSNIKPIIDGLEPQEIEDIEESLEWHNDAVVNVYTEAKEMSDNSFSTKDIGDLSSDDIILDLGDITQIKNILNNTKTVMWNGPLGYYELDAYMKSTSDIMNYLVDNNIKTILGGGDIVACSSKLGLKDKIYHTSTGGGATLEYLEGKTLPGIEVIGDIKE